MASILQDSSAYSLQASITVTSAQHAVQSFTPTIEYLLTSYKLNVSKGGGVANFITEMYLANGSGLPTGPKLLQSNVLQSTIPDGWTFVEFIPDLALNGGVYLVQPGVTYCILLKTDGGSNSWASRSIVDTYAGGKCSTYSGSWTDTGADQNFEIWGEVPGPEALPEYRIPVLQDFNWQPPVTGIQNDPPA